MRKILLLTLSAFTFVGAVAQYRDSENLCERLQWEDERLHIIFDSRLDGRLETGFADGKHLGFKGQSLRVWLEGEIVPGIRYRLRHRLNKAQDPQQDGLAAATDHAWVAFDFGNMKEWTITVGKQSVQLGTFEYDYSTADIYISTMVKSDFDNYKLGVNVAYRFLGQTLSLQGFNADSPQIASEAYKNKALGASLLWQGNLFDGVVRTRWAYTLMQHNKDDFYGWATAGLQLNAGEFTSELDYYEGNRNMDYGSVVGNVGLSEVRDQSASVNLKYGHGMWRPFIKGTWNKRHDKTLDSDAYETMGVQAFMECYPFAGHKYINDLRFHLGYGFTHTAYEGQWHARPSKNQHLLLAGVRWFFDVK